MPKFRVAVDRAYTYFISVEADDAEEAENFINDLLVDDALEDYLKENKPLEISDDGFGNPTVVD